MGMPQSKPRDTERARKLRNAATPAERQLWKYLSRSQFNGHKFSRQMPVGPYFCDFLCRAQMLVVELDGYSHDIKIEEDARRTSFLEEQGYRVLRFTNADVLSNIESVVTAIGLALAKLPTPNPSRKREGNLGQ